MAKFNACPRGGPGGRTRIHDIYIFTKYAHVDRVGRGGKKWSKIVHVVYG